MTGPHGDEAHLSPRLAGRTGHAAFALSPASFQSAQGAASHKTASSISYLESDEKDAHTNDRTPTWRRIYANTWTFEIVTMAFSIACFVAIIAILVVFDGNILSPLPYGLTLNAIVSTLATGAEGALVCVLASALSQLKWRWFQQRRRLYELQIFDDASRGALGSFQLLWGRTGNIIAIVGALLTILALAFDPFIQQVIRYPTRTTISKDGTATTHRATGFSPSVDGLDMISAVNSGIWADASQFARAPTCTSGNCKWPEFDSLGWCSKCEDATASATLTLVPNSNSTNYTLSLGSGQDITVSYGYPRQMNGDYYKTWQTETVWATHFHDQYVGDGLPNFVNESMAVSGPTVLGIQAPALVLGYAQLVNEGTVGKVSIDGDLDMQLRVTKAEQCALTPCVRTYNVQVSNGTLQSQTTATNYGVITAGTMFVPDSGSTNMDCWQPDARTNISYTQVRTTDPDGDLFFGNTSLSAFCPVSLYISTILPYLQSNSSATWAEGSPNQWTTDPFSQYSSDFIRRVGAYGLSFSLENLAASLTSFALSLSSDVVTGTVEVSTGHVMVRWEWLVYPLALEIAGLLVFAATIVLTRRHKTILWRSSLLPLLFHGFRRIYTVDSPPVPLDVAGMQVQAGKVYARLPRSSVGAEGRSLQEVL